MISLSVQDLKPAMAGLTKVIAAKHQLPCLRCIRVDASSERLTLMGTDLDMYARFAVPEFQCDATVSFLFPLDRLQSIVRRFHPRTIINLEAGKISCDLGTGRVVEDVESPEVADFPQEPEFHGEPVALPESFPRRFIEAMGCSSTDATRYVLNGTYLDVSGAADAGHYLVGTDGRHLFSANSFTLPLPESAIIPNHKLLMWRGLAEVPWAMVGQKEDKQIAPLVRIVAGDWTLTMKTVDGNYPNWRQVVPHFRQHRTTVKLPEVHEFTSIVNGLPGGEIKDRPVDLVIEGGAVAVKAITGGSKIQLVGAVATGPDVTTRLNRDFLTKALDYGLTNIGLIDGMSALQFTREGRQMVVMPLRVAEACPPQAHSAPTEQPAAGVPQQPEEPNQPAQIAPAATNKPAQVEPKPERSMTETNGHHTNGAATPYLNGAPRSTAPALPATDKPAIEAAIDKIEGFKASVRETLAGLTELTALLRQAVRDQKAGEKEIHTVRQTLRSLQGVRI